MLGITSRLVAGSSPSQRIVPAAPSMVSVASRVADAIPLVMTRCSPIALSLRQASLSNRKEN